MIAQKVNLWLFRVVVCILSVVFVMRGDTSYALRDINITHGIYEPTPIAVNFFDGESSKDKLIGKDIVSVITDDLHNSGVFRTIPTGAFIESRRGVMHRPLFAAWRQINGNLLLNGEITTSRGVVELRFRLWDCELERVIGGAEGRVSFPEKMWRRMAHKISDIIYEHVTGDAGYFDTRISYISETTIKGGRTQKRVAIMDYDGHNHKYLTDGKSIVVTPRFSPSGDKILYLSYEGRYPGVHLKDLRTGKDKVLKQFKGMSFAPRFSPDGKKAVMSVENDGGTHIFEIDLYTMKTRKLTDGYSINTSPNYSPDGRYIVFNSDRSGTRQLYVMRSDGSSVQRISFSGTTYATPVWSPTGEYIAFTKMYGGSFAIGVMRPDGSEERLITSGFLVEGPTWSPSGRMIMYSRGEKVAVGEKNYLYMIDLTGYNEQMIPTPHNASDPEWSLSLPLN